MSETARLAEVTKRYGSTVALHPTTLSLAPGVIGLLGPNGAGKTTTMAMLVGLARPTAGDGTILGVPIRDTARALRRVGGSGRRQVREVLARHEAAARHRGRAAR